MASREGCEGRPETQFIARVKSVTEWSLPPSKYMPEGLHRCWVNLYDLTYEAPHILCGGPSRDALLAESIEYNCRYPKTVDGLVSGVVHRMDSGQLVLED